MKIDPRADSTQEVAAATADSTRQPARSGSQTSDAIQLSGEVRLADEAVRVAALSGDVRPRAVARARDLLQSGKLGADHGAVADRIIESLIQSRADRS